MKKEENRNEFIYICTYFQTKPNQIEYKKYHILRLLIRELSEINAYLSMCTFKYV